MSEDMLFANCIDTFTNLQKLEGQKMVSISGRIHKVAKSCHN